MGVGLQTEVDWEKEEKKKKPTAGNFALVLVRTRPLITTGIYRPHREISEHETRLHTLGGGIGMDPCVKKSFGEMNYACRRKRLNKRCVTTPASTNGDPLTGSEISK